jgi:hypothetical protein
MQSQAKPITTHERRARIERARRLMVENRLDALMLMGGASLECFTNIRWGGGAQSNQGCRLRSDPLTTNLLVGRYQPLVGQSRP